MASIKERAAALNLTGKLYSPMHHPEQQVVGRPCQSSFVWKKLIAHLQSEVKVKRRRHFLKLYDNCFVGSDAVTVIQTYINQSKVVGVTEVPRAKAVRVCQALLDCKVFEAVSVKVFGKESKLSRFQDSDGSFYRFLNMQNPVLNCAEHTFTSPSELRKADSQPRRQVDPLFCHSTPVKPGHIMDILLEELSPSFLQTEHLQESVVNQVWQEQTVQRLLQLIELPLLDGVLECGESHSLPSCASDEPDQLYTSNYLDREILKAFKESQKDDWLLAALELMDFLPDHLVVETSRELPSFSLQDEDEEGNMEHVYTKSTGIEQCKLLLFNILAKHYGHANIHPLLPDGLNDVYTHTTELLVNGKFAVALEVLQLCLKLLPAATREELCKLLNFMSLAADPEQIQLHKEIDNRKNVKRTFCRAIIQNKNLPKGKVDLLLLFMLDNHEEIFKIPGSLHKLVSDRLDDILKKKDPNMSSSAFCQQISGSVYSDSVKELTKNELFMLLKNIDENTKYSVKEKRRLLAQFYKGHPEIFAQYFGSRLHTINLFDV